MLKASRKKLWASLILLIVAIVFLVIGAPGVLLFLLQSMNVPGISSHLSGAGVMAYGIIGMLLVFAGYVIFLVSVILNLIYRKSTLSPGGLSTFMFVVAWIELAPFMLVYLLATVFTGGNDKPKVVKVADKDGKVHVLTQTYSGSFEYKDESGALWKTFDGGQTFECVINKIEFDDGKKHTLTPTYDDWGVKYYKDEEGNEWKSTDGGKTFEKQ